MNGFDWALFIKIAQELLEYAEKKIENQEREAYLRSSISRAYYGVFGVALKKLIERNILHSRLPNIHKRVVEAYQKLSRKLNDNRLRMISINLYRLREYRRKADYEEQAQITLQLAQISLNIAKQTLNILRQFQS